MTSVVGGYAGRRRVPVIAAVSTQPRDRSLRTRSLVARAGWVVETVSVMTVAAAVVVSLVWPLGAVTMALPFAVLAVVVGIPHGAADGPILATARRRAGRFSACAYLGGFVAVGAAVWLATVPAVLVLLVLAVVHFGLGEVEYGEAAVTSGSPKLFRSGGSWQRRVAVIGFGGVVVAVPFAVHPHPVDTVLRALDPALVTVLSPGVRWIAAAVAVACLFVTVVVKVRCGQPREAVEGLLLLTMGMVAPPVLTFAVFFGAWHSLRHLSRLLLVGGATRNTDGPVAAERLDRRLLFWSATGSVAVVTAAGAVLVWSGASPVRLLAILVAGLLALTVPHAVVVAWFDRRPGTLST